MTPDELSKLAMDTATCIWWDWYEECQAYELSGLHQERFNEQTQSLARTVLATFERIQQDEREPKFKVGQIVKVLWHGSVPEYLKIRRVTPDGVHFTRKGQADEIGA